MPSVGCGHYAPNRDYAGEALAIKEERKVHAESLAEIESRLGLLCYLCEERSLETREFGGACYYIACADVPLCEGRRHAKLAAMYPNEFREM